MEYLNKRHPLPPLGGWTIQDEMAVKSTFDFKGSDLGFRHEPLEFAPIAPKDSLSRTTFWLSVESPGRLKFKCNLAEQTDSFTLTALKQALAKHDRLEASRNIMHSDDSSVEKELQKPPKISITFDTKLGKQPGQVDDKKVDRIRIKEKTTQKFSKTGRVGRVNPIYKFIDWEKKADEKYSKPQGFTDLNKFRKKRVLPSYLEVQQPIIEKPKPKEKQDKWITLTDMGSNITFHNLVSNKDEIDEIQRHSQGNEPVSRARIAPKIFQGKGAATEVREGNTNKSVSQYEYHPLFETRTRIGIVAEEHIYKREQRDQKPQLVIKPREIIVEDKDKEKPPVIDLTVYGIHPENKIIEEFEQAKSILLIKQRQAVNSHDKFDYTVTTPPYLVDSKGHLIVNYTESLAAIYSKNPVKSLYYFYHGLKILTHENIILQLMNKYEYTDKAEREKEVNYVTRQYSVIEDEGKNSELSIITSRPRFKYVLLKVGLDDKLNKADLEPLNDHEYKMMVAFFNVKFSILDKPDKLNLDDPIEHVIKVANAHIEGVLVRANNFKKNEEFLKKKWKEFLKFCRFKVKEEFNLKRSNI